jgi:hypothetical protein
VSIARYPATSGAMPATTNDGLIAGHDLDRGGALMRVHPNNYQSHLSPPARPVTLFEQGGHRYFEQNKALFSLAPLHGSARPAQAK